MGEASGRLTGEAGIAPLTGGTGHANGVSALFTALAADPDTVLVADGAEFSQWA